MSADFSPKRSIVSLVVVPFVSVVLVGYTYSIKSIVRSRARSISLFDFGLLALAGERYCSAFGYVHKRFVTTRSRVEMRVGYRHVFSVIGSKYVLNICLVGRINVHVVLTRSGHV